MFEDGRVPDSPSYTGKFPDLSECDPCVVRCRFCKELFLRIFGRCIMDDVGVLSFEVCISCYHEFMRSYKEKYGVDAHIKKVVETYHNSREMK